RWIQGVVFDGCPDRLLGGPCRTAHCQGAAALGARLAARPISPAPDAPGARGGVSVRIEVCSARCPSRGVLTMPGESRAIAATITAAVAPSGTRDCQRVGFE